MLSAEFNAGTVLWFRPEVGRGVVKSDDGQQFFFDTHSGINEPVRGLRVLVRNVSGDDGARGVELKLPEGGRQYAESDPDPVAARRRTTKTRKTTARKASKPKTGPKRGVVTRVVLAGESLERGISVLHPQHGQGFVVLSNSSMARIRFMPSQEERSVRVADLEVLEG
jgi:cold shock CspA family protein